MAVRNLVGTMDAVSAFEAAFPSRRPKKEDILEAMKELVTNGGDAGAPNIDIILKPKEKMFRIEDNGHGFDEESQRGYLTLYSSAKKGRQGVTGQYGTGRTRALAFAPTLQVYSVSKNFPKGTTMTLTRDMLQELYVKHTVTGEWHDGAKLPQWWHLKGSQTGSAVVIGIRDEDWRYVISADVLRKELAGKLKLSTAEKVTVNGEKLEKRRIVGDPIRRIFTTDELGPVLAKAFGGPVEVELFIPHGGREKGEEVRLGGHHPICGILDFMRQVNDPELTGSIPEILTTNVIVGDIFFPILNDHVAEDRKSLKDSVLKGMHLHLINFMSNTLGPILVDAYQKHEDDREREATAKAIQSFVTNFNQATGMDPDIARKLHTPKGDNKKGGSVTDMANAPIVVNRREVELCPGDTQKLKVVRLNGVKEENLVWVEKESDKDTIVSVGASYTYTAEALGTFIVTVRDKTKPSISVDITVYVERKRTLVITPGRARIERGGSQEFRLRNGDSTSGVMRWEILTMQGTKVGGGMQLRSSKGMSVTLDVGDRAPLGKFKIRVTDTKDTETFVETEFVVHQDIPPDLLMIDGIYYRVSEGTWVQGTPIVLTQDVDFAPSGDATIGTISVNFQHEDFVHAGIINPTGFTKTLLLQELVIIAHCEAEHLQNRITGVAEFTQKTAELRSMLLKTGAGK